jgi:hypothetical protein
MNTSDIGIKCSSEEKIENVQTIQPPKKKLKPIPKAVLAEQLKDWKSPVPPAIVPAYRAQYTGYTTRSRTAKRTASLLSHSDTSVDELSTQYNDYSDNSDDYDDSEKVSHRRSSETQRVVWSRHEELILEHELRVNPFASFAEILERYRNEFHPSRTPKKLEAHYYHMKKEKEKRQKAQRFKTVRPDQPIDPKKYNDIPIIYSDNTEDSATPNISNQDSNRSLSTPRPRVKLLMELDDCIEGENFSNSPHVNRKPTRSGHNIEYERNNATQCKVVTYTLPNVKEGLAIKRQELPPIAHTPGHFSDVEELLYFEDAIKITLDRNETNYSQVLEEDTQLQRQLRKAHEAYNELLQETNFYKVINQKMGSLALLRGEKFEFPVNTREVFIGRITRSSAVDIDLSEAANERKQKISRIQAVIKLRHDVEFYVKNLGKSAVFVNGQIVERNQTKKLVHNCLLEIGGIPFVFETNLVTIATIREEMQKTAQNVQLRPV